MKCKYTAALSENGWCRTASMYCTSTQEAFCVQKAVAQTNGDYIRGMTDEELGEFLSNVYFGGFDDGLHRPPRVEKTLYTTDWLRQPKETP